MYSVMLVDDERLTLDNLANYIDWEKMSCRVIATASNGKEALAKIELEQPDILITDVKMPVMDGIELCKQVHARFSNIQIVFLSGYNEFDYACAAMHHGACGYLLKPIDHDELTAIMKKVSERCESQKRLLNSSLLTTREYLRELLQIGGSLLSGLVEEVTTLFNKHLHLPLDNRNFQFALISIDEYSLLKENRLVSDSQSDDFSTVEKLEFFIVGLPSFIPGILTKVHDHMWVFVTKDTVDKSFLIWRNQSVITERWVSLFIPNTSQTLLAFTKEWPKLVQMRDYLVAVQGPGLMIDNLENVQTRLRTTPYPKTEQLISAVQQKDRTLVDEWLEDFYDEGLPSGNISQVFIESVSVSNAVISAVAANNSQLQELIAKDSDFFGRLSQMESMKSMKAHMHQLLNLLMDELEASTDNRQVEMINEVCTIIENNYGGVISIDMLTDIFYLSPNYLRTIFKEVTGKTLNEYVTQVRMEKACRMLQDTNNRVYEIAKQVGYDNPSYFGTVFFKHTGLTPNQYRVSAKRAQQQ